MAGAELTKAEGERRVGAASAELADRLGLRIRVAM